MLHIVRINFPESGLEEEPGTFSPSLSSIKKFQLCDRKNIEIKEEILPEQSNEIKDRQRTAYTTWQNSSNMQWMSLIPNDGPCRVTKCSCTTIKMLVEYLVRQCDSQSQAPTSDNRTTF
jgi:hypothetical protein